ncbi:MAG: 30S ribosomal protein S17 [Candidatus Micrarchaeota archaeon]
MTEACDDKKCFKHGSVRVRGETLMGKVVSTKGKRTAIIERATTKKLEKYQRWATEKSRIAAHNPACINAKTGDMVLIGETRKLSKTKAWTVTEITKGGEAE